MTKLVKDKYIVTLEADECRLYTTTSFKKAVEIAKYYRSIWGDFKVRIAKVVVDYGEEIL